MSCSPSTPDRQWLLPAEALRVALRTLGRGETEGNNRGRYITAYWGIGLQRAPRHGPWCAVWVCYCYQQAAYKLDKDLPFRPTASAKRLARRCAAVGDWLPVSRDWVPYAPGAIVLWHRGSGISRRWKGHVGLLDEKAWHMESDTLYTIEANRGPYPSSPKRYAHRNGSWRKDLVGIVVPV